MGLYRGKRKKGLYLANKKPKRYQSYKTLKKRQHSLCQKQNQIATPLHTSTPFKLKRSRLDPCSSTKKVFKSPFHKRPRLLSPVVCPASVSNAATNHSKRTLNFDSLTCTDQLTGLSDFEVLDDTCLYSDGSILSFISEETHNISEKYDDETSQFPTPSNIGELCSNALKVLNEQNIDKEFVSFLKLVSQRKFPLDNVSLQLFVAVIKWFESEDTRSVRYNDTSLKFFWLGKRLFGGRFLRFMGGPKNETGFLQGNTHLLPSESKINFACPSDRILSSYNPLGFDLSLESGSGLIEPMIDLVANKNNENLSYVIMFDGKKIKRGADMDLLGFENEPLSERRGNFDADVHEIAKAIQIVQRTEELNETNQILDTNVKKELYQTLLKCFKIVSRYIMEMRKLRKTKEMALAKYKERIEKDPSLAKSLEYAIDSCRTATYLADNCVSSLLDVQWEVCRTGSYLNGTLRLFQRTRAGKINLDEQENVFLLPDENSDDVPTNLVKQRTQRWFDERKHMKVTGSTLYAAVGCDGLKRLHSHFDNVVSNVDKDAPTESQKKAMDHGTESEVHEIATLAGVVMPFLFPTMVYFEEGYYLQNDAMVSPDGSLRDVSGSKVFYAFEGKAPSNNSSPRCRQHYQVPERYITQTLFEQRVMGAESGTLYLCWTPDSTTVFKIPASESICTAVQCIVNEVYTCEVPKRPTRIPKETKKLKETIKEHVKQCEFLGEFPSVTATNIPTRDYFESGLSRNEIETFSYQDLTRSLLKAKQSMKDAYNLRRIYASQVLVYLLADLDRLWKPELPHAIPVMFCYRGYSLHMETARNLLEHCAKACTKKGLHVAAVSSDGEFIQLIAQGRAGQPLTIYQLSKQVWVDVCKIKKHELIKALKSVNKQHKVVTNESGKTSVESIDDGFRVKTPTRGWTKKTRSTKSSDSEDCHLANSCSNEVPHVTQSKGEGETDDGTHTKENEPNAEGDLDDTVSYDFEELLQDSEDKELHESVISIDEAKDIAHLFKQRMPTKWKDTSPMEIMEIIFNSLPRLLKVELLDIANYLNLKFIGTENALKVNNVTKGKLLEQLSKLFGTRYEHIQRKRSKRIMQTKSLRDLAASVLIKPNYPKQVLNIAYASYIWPKKVKEWKTTGKIAERIRVVGKTDDDLYFDPYYSPEYIEDENDFRVFTYDKTHLGTNLRKAICLDRVKDISINAWKTVSQKRPDILHPSIIEVSDGKIIDQMKEKLARTIVSMEVETEMIKLDFVSEAEFCNVVREGLYTADDTPGIPAFERCKKRLALIEWLNKDVDFGQFPPYGGFILGLSHVLYEGLRTSQEAKLYLYALANSGTYCVRAPNTLCSESFFGSMQEMDPWGQGILSADGVKKHLADFTTITAMKMDETRNIHIKTKKDTAYPVPTVQPTAKGLSENHQSYVCDCRKKKFIKCILPKDHFFDTEVRARLLKPETVYKPSMSGPLRGEQPVRSQYGYKINEARMLPSKRLALDVPTNWDLSDE